MISHLFPIFLTISICSVSFIKAFRAQSTPSNFLSRAVGFSRQPWPSTQSTNSALFAASAEPVSSFGKPVVKRLDKEAHVANIMVTLSGEQTQSAFQRACDLYNVEVKNRGYKVPGFRPGAKLPANYLYQMFGENTVKKLCATLLDQSIQEECEKTGLALVGRGRINDFNELGFTAGSPHTFEVECDLWPNISYGKNDGYKGLSLTVTKGKFDGEKYDKVKLSIQERYKILTSTPVGYAAKHGDVVIANMKGYEKAPDGSKGAPLPSVASGESVEILLEKGKFMEGLIEGIEGSLAGETKTVAIQFPVRPGGAGAALSGKSALFEVDVLEVKTKSLPNWDADLAERVRPGMTLADLDNEVRKAIDGEQEGSMENLRNEVIAKTLLDSMVVSKIPESLIDETVQSRFQNMLADFKEQGSTDEQLQEMATPEKYNKYKEISRPNAEKIVTLGLAFRDIAEKEKNFSDRD